MSTTNIEALADILALPMTDGNLTTQASAETALVVARHLDKHGVSAPGRITQIPIGRKP
jgi:hypothetical protein